MHALFYNLQFHHIFVPPSSDPYKLWSRCQLHLTDCNLVQLAILQGIHSFPLYGTMFCLVLFLNSLFGRNGLKRKIWNAILFFLYDGSIGFFVSVYRYKMLGTLRQFEEGSRTGGLYINSCFAHCQSELQDTWFGANSPRINNKVLCGAIFFYQLLLWSVNLRKKKNLV